VNKVVNPPCLFVVSLWREHKHGFAAFLGQFEAEIETMFVKQGLHTLECLTKTASHYLGGQSGRFGTKRLPEVTRLVVFLH